MGLAEYIGPGGEVTGEETGVLVWWWQEEWAHGEVSPPAPGMGPRLSDSWWYGLVFCNVLSDSDRLESNRRVYCIDVNE